MYLAKYGVDNKKLEDEEVIEAGQQHPSMYEHDSDDEDLPDYVVRPDD